MIRGKNCVVNIETNDTLHTLMPHLDFICSAKMEMKCAFVHFFVELFEVRSKLV